MIINIFLYTTDEQTAIDKTKEILSFLEIKDIVSISSELYWKFSDMTVTHTETISNIYPDKNILKRIADIWWGWESGDYIGTSDTTTDNTIHVSDVAMVDLSISKPDNYRSNSDGKSGYIEWYTADDLPSPSDTEGVLSLIKVLGNDVYYFVRKEPDTETAVSDLYLPEKLIYITDNPQSYRNLVIEEWSEYGRSYEWYRVNDAALIKEYITANSKSFNILILRKDSVDFLYYISAWDNIIAIRDYAGNFKDKYNVIEQ